MSKKAKACIGLGNIHFAPFGNSGYIPPVKIRHGKKISNKFKYENIQEWADNVAVINEFLYGGGEGSLSVLGLDKDENVLLLGNKAVKGGIAVTDVDEAPTGAFLFERRKVGGGRRLYVVYACKCSPIDIEGETIEEGKGTYEVNEITYSISAYEHEGVNLIYYYIDTDDTTVDPEQVTNWYKEVQFPAELNSSPAEINNVNDDIKEKDINLEKKIVKK